MLEDSLAASLVLCLLVRLVVVMLWSPRPGTTIGFQANKKKKKVNAILSVMVVVVERIEKRSLIDNGQVTKRSLSLVPFDEIMLTRLWRFPSRKKRKILFCYLSLKSSNLLGQGRRRTLPKLFCFLFGFWPVERINFRPPSKLVCECVLVCVTFSSPTRESSLFFRKSNRFLNVWQGT